MIKVLMVLINAIRARFGLAKAVGGAVLAVAYSDRIEAEFYKYVADEVEKKTGLSLSPSAPLSDASVSAALSSRCGFPVSSIYDVSALRDSVMAHVASVLTAKLGFQIDDVTDSAGLHRALEAKAVAVFQSATGVAFTDISSAAAIEADIINYVEANMTQLIESKINDAAAKISGGDDDVLALIALSKEVRGSKEGAQSVRSAAAMLGVYEVAGGVQAREIRRDKRREQMRIAQAKFRALHGDRRRYG